MNNITNQLSTTNQDITKYKVMPTDILVNELVIRQNMDSLRIKTRKKRRIDYAKKILNDEYIFKA